ncbi:hypothetical protein C8R45DRAFT_452972 [Mycena sanguinolenta]|nr:hypothetical protein C8R45DRAFT_452972 [Mycena sanguinolenta]
MNLITGTSLMNRTSFPRSEHLNIWSEQVHWILHRRVVIPSLYLPRNFSIASEGLYSELDHLHGLAPRLLRTKFRLPSRLLRLFTRFHVYSYPHAQSPGLVQNVSSLLQARARSQSRGKYPRGDNIPEPIAPRSQCFSTISTSFGGPGNNGLALPSFNLASVCREVNAAALEYYRHGSEIPRRAVALPLRSPRQLSQPGRGKEADRRTEPNVRDRKGKAKEKAVAQPFEDAREGSSDTLKPPPRCPLPRSPDILPRSTKKRKRRSSSFNSEDQTHYIDSNETLSLSFHSPPAWKSVDVAETI